MQGPQSQYKHLAAPRHHYCNFLHHFLLTLLLSPPLLWGQSCVPYLSSVQIPSCCMPMAWKIAQHLLPCLCCLGGDDNFVLAAMAAAPICMQPHKGVPFFLPSVVQHEVPAKCCATHNMDAGVPVQIAVHGACAIDDSDRSCTSTKEQIGKRQMTKFSFHFQV